MKKGKIIKKISCIAAAATLAASVGTPVLADNGSGASVYATAGKFLYSDIAAYINHYPIPSWSMDGYMYIVAEDLRNYGFNVEWDENTRSLSITPNYQIGEIAGISPVYKYSNRKNEIFAVPKSSDIVTYFNGRQIPSYTLNGYTMIPIESLANSAEGTEYTWDQSTRSAKLWESWTSIAPYQPLPEDPENTYVYSQSTDYNENAYIIDGDYCGIGNNAGGIESVLWTLDSNGLLIVSGDGEMVRNWSSLKSQIRGWGEYCHQIKTVIIEEGVTNIGRYSFEGCDNLQTIYIPKSVVEIGDLGIIPARITVHYAGGSEQFTAIGGYNAIKTGTYKFYSTPGNEQSVDSSTSNTTITQNAPKEAEKAMLAVKSLYTQDELDRMGYKFNVVDYGNKYLVEAYVTKNADGASRYWVYKANNSVEYLGVGSEWYIYDGTVYWNTGETVAPDGSQRADNKVYHFE